MILKTIYFDSFKSLVDEKLEINNKCTGIVGINESGKSNILEAIRILNEDYHLEKKHVPKIIKTQGSQKNPRIRYEFLLRKDQENDIRENLKSWLKTNSLIEENLTDFLIHIEYIIEYKLDAEEEVRNFSVKAKNSIGNSLILKREYLNSKHKFFYKNSLVSLEEALLLTNDIITSSKNSLNEKRKQRESLKVNLQNTIEELQEFEQSDVEKEEFAEKKVEIEKKIADLQSQLNQIEEEWFQYDIEKIIGNKEKELESIKEEINEILKLNDSFEKTRNTLKSKSGTLNPHEKGQLTKAENSYNTGLEKLEIRRNSLKEIEDEISSLKVPLEEKYTANVEELNFYLTRLLQSNLPSFLPPVVFWKHSKDFILQSKTNFEEILKAKSLAAISRPLLNVFRIGLEIDTLEELKKKINTIQNDDGERSRLNSFIDKRINKYIDEVWPDYDQDVKISLEEHQIRIEFFDPKFEGNSFFNMDEKSQGAQTFLSFLMTVGAEAAHGVLKNKILLLDEPETHLHPSGVRFMLQELIKISQKNNIVIFATHSVFMIDKKNYERHIFLKKENEKTSINISKKDRIGYFMQEEVLFGALGFDLENDFNTKGIYNFVFEGKGDVVLFKHYYTRILDPKQRPFDLKKSNFFQGGKCSDIIKFLKKNPIKLGTKWIFIIDKDGAAETLKKFIESNYKAYLGKEIFLFQYQVTPKVETVLEDLLPDSFLKKVYKSTCQMTGDKYEGVGKIQIEDQGFIQYNNKIMEELEIKEGESYKGLWKDNLNKQIEKDIEPIKSDEEMKKLFPIYSEWLSNVIKGLESLSKINVSKRAEGIPVESPTKEKSKKVIN